MILKFMLSLYIVYIVFRNKLQDENMCTKFIKSYNGLYTKTIYHYFSVDFTLFTIIYTHFKISDTVCIWYWIILYRLCLDISSYKMRIVYVHSTVSCPACMRRTLLLRRTPKLSHSQNTSARTQNLCNWQHRFLFNVSESV